MKNIKSIKQTRAQELETKNAAEAAAARQAELEAIEEVDSFGTIEAVKDGKLASVADEEDNLLGIEGGKYHTTVVNGKAISAKTVEELDEIKARMANGIEGDELLHKTVYILGMPCDIHGKNEAELEADLKAAEEAAYAHKWHMARDVIEAEALNADGYTEKDGKEITVRGRTCLILWDEQRVIMAGSHETLIDLGDKDELGNDAAKLSKESIEKILVEKLNKKFEEEDASSYDEYEDDWNDNDEDDEDDWDEDWD